jgi:hypothetical protein
VQGDYWFRHNIGLTAAVQYGRWLFPVIQPNPERTWTGLFQIQFQPQKILKSPFHKGERN